MKQTSLSEQIIQAIFRKGKKNLLWCIVKTLLVWSVGWTVLILTGKQSDRFTLSSPPLWFWMVFAIVLIFPIWKFQIYKFFRTSVHGEVTAVENTQRLGGKKEDVGGYIDTLNIGQMGRVDTCIVTVTGARRGIRKYEFARESAQFAREYYQQGDTVFVPTFAEYPFNESREAEKPFCLCCGRTAGTHEAVCSACGVQLVKKEEGKATV